MARISDKSRPSWVLNKLLLLIKEKHTLWYRLKSKRLPETQAEYREHFKRVKKEISAAVASYELGLTVKVKSDHKLIYSYTKSK